MALTGSGAISLNEIHIEAGGSSGTTCSLNDSDIRDLIGASSGATMSFDDWYGASAYTPSAGLDLDETEYIQIDGNMFDWGTDDFTLEGWFLTLRSNSSGTSSGWRTMFGWMTDSHYGGNIAIRHNSERIEWNWGNDAGGSAFDFMTGSTDTITVGKWYHFAAVMDNGTAEMFIDGVSGGSTSRTGSFGDIGSGMRIGRGHSSYSTQDWDGYIDGIRISSVARYTSNFTPSSIPFASDSDTILLLQMDGENDTYVFTDTSSNAHTVTRGGNAVISTGAETSSPYRQKHYFSNRWQGVQAVWAGGYSGSTRIGTIDKHAIASIGTITDQGDLQQAKADTDSLSSKTRIAYICGYNNAPGPVNEIDVIAVASTGTAADFGDWGVTIWSAAPMSSGTRGVGASGRQAGSEPSTVNNLYYINLAANSNAASFGTVDSDAVGYAGAGISNATRGVWAGGYVTNSVNTYRDEISYITFDSLGNSNDFHDLSVPKASLEGAENATRGVFAGGGIAASPYRTATMDYITVATTGTVGDQGDLSTALSDGVHTAVDEGKALISGNDGGSYDTNRNIYTFQIASGGGSDTGSDLSITRADCSGASGT